MTKPIGLNTKISTYLDRWSGWFIFGITLITLLLTVPMLLMQPQETASDNPGGKVYDLENLYKLRLPPRFHGSFYILEPREGNVLARPVLNELLRNSKQLREADSRGKLNPKNLPAQPYLFNGFDVDRQEPVFGIFSFADAVGQLVELERATDREIQLAVETILSDPRSENVKSLLYGLYQDENGNWIAPAMGIFVTSDNQKLGGGVYRIGATGGPGTKDKEEFSRTVQQYLRGEQKHYQLWGVAIDAGLEIDDEVGTAVPFIIATFLMVLVIVGVTLRSVKIIGLTAIGLIFMFIWLKGLSNLIGLKSSTTLDFIVPIAMISLGADFMIHAVKRYREEQQLISDPRRAFRIGMAGVITALALAMITDAVAFLANITAPIETVIGFGIGAGLAIFSAFVIMGLAIPIALMRLDSKRVRNQRGSAKNILEQTREKPTVDSSLAPLLLKLIQLRWAVLTCTVLITTGATFFAMQLEPTFDVKDFFKKDSDFVIGLDKMDEYIGDTAGENAIIYIEGDLSNPSSLKAISEFVTTLKDNRYVAKSHGDATIQARTIFNLLDQVMRSDFAKLRIEETTGISINSDQSIHEFVYQGRVYLWPDDQKQIKAIYDYISANGVPASVDQMIYDSFQVRETLSLGIPPFESDATAVVIGIPGTREQSRVVASRTELTSDIIRLKANTSLSLVGLTGSPYTRQASLDATTNGLQNALLVAMALCLLIVVIALRSLKFGIATIIPIGLVVVWLYSFMYIFGFGLNFVTATIAAVSIGVGVDFAVHMTMRYREELNRNESRVLALTKAVNGTGMALVASAATSIAGFAIMAFAPMPMFASYGILTAVMIAMATIASLLVLPPILFIISKDPRNITQDKMDMAY